MGTIIKLIIKIFEAIFEEDLAQRQRRSQARRPAYPARRPGSSYLQARSATTEHASPQERLLQEIFSSFQPQVVPPVPSISPPQQGYPATGAKEIVEEYHTVQEHLTETRERMEEVERHTSEYLHLDRRQKKRVNAKQQDLIYGMSLEQMVVAQVVLGPCKAHQRFEGSGSTGFRR